VLRQKQRKLKEGHEQSKGNQNAYEEHILAKARSHFGVEQQQKGCGHQDPTMSNAVGEGNNTVPGWCAPHACESEKRGVTMIRWTNTSGGNNLRFGEGR